MPVIDAPTTTIDKPEIAEAIELGDIVKVDDGSYEITEQGRLRAQVSLLVQVIATAYFMHVSELSKWKIKEFLEEELTKLTPRVEDDA